MKFFKMLVWFVFLSGLALSATPKNPQPGENGLTGSHLIQNRDFGRLPLYFIPNRGQLDKEVLFYAKASGQTIYFTRRGIAFDMLRFPQDAKRNEPQRRADKHMGERLVFRMLFSGSNPDAEIRGVEQASGRVNYLIGNDPKKWITNLPVFRQIVYRDVYPKIDCRVYGNNGVVEYDLVVNPGAKVEDIRLAYSGVNQLQVRPAEVIASTPFGDLMQVQPILYQEIGKQRKPVSGGFRALAANQFGFRAGSFDSRQPLVIDPVLAYSTYLGGTADDVGEGIATDNYNAFVCGSTNSNTFPTQDGYDGSYNSGGDAFVTKMNEAGDGLVYSTYLGGSGGEEAYGIDVSGGEATVVGITSSDNFPLQNPYQAARAGGRDAFITVLNADGNGLLWSTYLGGSSDDHAYGVCVKVDKIYLVGTTWSTDFPVGGSVQNTSGGGSDAFVAKFTTAGAFNFSTYFGGSGGDFGEGITVDLLGTGSDDVYITGETTGSFPLYNAYQGTYGGGTVDAFVVKILTTGSPLLFSTYLGGDSSEWGFGIAVDKYHNVFVAGETYSSNFPVTASAYQSSLNNYNDCYLTKFNSSGSALLYSSFLGGSYNDGAWSVAVSDDPGNTAVIAGYGSSGFPLKNPVQGTYGGQNSDVIVAKFDTSQSGEDSLVWSTYLGGDGDEQGRAIAAGPANRGYYQCDYYVTGYTESWYHSPTYPYPTVNPFQSSQAGGRDAFISKLNDAEIRVDPTSVSFGNVYVGSSSSWTTVTVYNDGQGTLFTKTVTLEGTNPGDFEIQNDTVSDYHILPGQSATIQVRFTPTATGARSAILHIPNSDTNENPIDITLSGTGQAPEAPTVTTTTATAITNTTASSGGNVTSDGGDPVTARGVCWSTSSNPTTADSHTSDGTGVGSFSSSLTGLTRLTIYHYRAYATNSYGTVYGNDKSFVTLPDLPVVTTSAAYNITSNSATCGGNVTDGGGVGCTKGVCWSTSPNPTIAGSHTDEGVGNGTFFSYLTGLTPNTLYHHRAYATNGAGTSYGSDLTFTTLVATPTVTTTAISNITYNSAQSGGNVTSDGGASITARGVCWNTTGTPTIADSYTSDGSSTGVFTSTLSPLAMATTYYVRAYATNSAGTGYGEQLTFTTATVNLPTVTTAAITSITQTSAVSGGNVSSDGGAPVTEFGVCWSTLANPTIADSHTSDGSGTGNYSSSLTGLTAGTTYHVRAYATNFAGTGYGNDLSFTTNLGIYYNSPSSRLIVPEVNWADAQGGGQWISEVQIVDLSGGSTVQVYYNSGTSRQGPFTLWSNGGGANVSTTFANILQTIDGLDGSTFVYNGTSGALELITQDNAHLIQATVRTANGNYSRTFPGLADVEANTASATRELLIPNISNDASYRPSVVLFNPGSDSMTVDLFIRGTDGSPIGPAITRVLAGYEMSVITTELRAYTYSNAIVGVKPIPGSVGRVMASGQTANNVTNDPAAHLAMQAGLGFDNSPAQQKFLTEVNWAPAAGGGEWISEVQLVDLTPDSSVQVYYDSGTTSHGPFTLWTNSGGPYSSVTFANILETIDSLDSGPFTYYGTSGTLRFVTQDVSHVIQASVRTYNGNCSRSFPAFADLASHSVASGRPMLIPGITNNASYRPSVVLFNPSADAVTVELSVIGSDGVQIGSVIGRTVSGMEMVVLTTELQAVSYTNACVRVQATSGSGRVLVTGQMANNISNDPAAHVAVQLN